MTLRLPLAAATLAAAALSALTSPAMAERELNGYGVREQPVPLPYPYPYPPTPQPMPYPPTLNGPLPCYSCPPIHVQGPALILPLSAMPNEQ